MGEKTYHLLAKDDGPYEIFHTGYSFLVLVLQLFWAITNGVLIKYTLLALPLIPFSILSIWNPSLSAFLMLGYTLITFGIYFPRVAFSWREKLLLTKGYKLKCKIAATSAKEALEKYAKSVS